MAGGEPKSPPLGPIEEAVLEQLWRVGECDVIEAHSAVRARTGISVNTVGSSMERLYRKGLVSRRKVSHAYRYKPTLTRDDFLARRLIESAGGLESLASSGLLASFLDLVTNVDDKALDELEKLIAKKRQEKQ